MSVTSIDLRMSERDLQDAVVGAAKLGAWLVYHTHDSRRSEGGFPDLVLVRGRLCIFSELKSEKGRVSHEQATWISHLRAAGQLVAVWRPSDLDRVVRLLTARGWTDDALREAL